ncbi:MAG: NRDE family protein [Desulfococcaceae bacterium]
MCLILFLYDIRKDYRLVLGANRDELYERWTAPLDFWEESPDILAGRDLKGGGTWMGITRSGRFAALTNYRDPASLRANAPSRGELVSGFLRSRVSPSDYMEKLQSAGHRYNGFNLILGDRQDLFYYSNRGDGVQKLGPGLYGLSNRFLDTPWPKLEKGKAGFSQLGEQKEPDPEEIFHILGDRSTAPDDQLPETGVSREWERMLSSMFIHSPVYGTRSSSALLISQKGEVCFAERTFVPTGDGIKEEQTRSFRFFIR